MKTKDKKIKPKNVHNVVRYMHTEGPEKGVHKTTYFFHSSRLTARGAQRILRRSDPKMSDIKVLWTLN